MLYNVNYINLKHVTINSYSIYYGNPNIPGIYYNQKASYLVNHIVKLFPYFQIICHYQIVL